MKDKIGQDIKEAMRRKDTARLSILRMMLAELQHKEKEKGIPVTDETALVILQSMIRKRKEAIELFRSGSREDLAEKEQREIQVIQEYLPRQLSEDEIREQVRAAIAELGVRSPQEMGRIMGLLTKKLAGSAQGSTISRLVKEELHNLTA